MQDNIIDVCDQAGEDKSNEEDRYPGCLSFVSLGATVEAKVLEGYESKDAELL